MHILHKMLSLALSHCLYKDLDNLGGFKRFFGKQPNHESSSLIFGRFTFVSLPVTARNSRFDLKRDLFTNLIGSI